MYQFNIELKLPADQAVTAVTEALQQEKLGVVSDVNVQSIVKNKLDKDIPVYRILGACHPGLALRVIEADPDAGALLPCNVVVRGKDAERTVVVFMDPNAVLGLSDRSEVRAVAEEAYGILQRVVERLRAAHGEDAA
jgi:uncharacterized protein (DUF302 family)